MPQPTRCEQCGQFVTYVDDVAYTGRELGAVMIVHGCLAAPHEIPEPDGELLVIDDPTPASGLLAQLGQAT